VQVSVVFNRINVVTLTPPGRLPTVVHDPGGWWSLLAGDERFHLSRYSANFGFWQVLCSPEVVPLLGETVVRRVWQKLKGVDHKETGLRAQRALELLQSAEAFSSPRTYIQNITAIVDHLNGLNSAQEMLWFSVEDGVHVPALDYSSSSALCDYAGNDGLLRRLIEGSLHRWRFPVDLLVVKITTPEDLLTAMISLHLFRRTNPGMHACLADHSYENFSLAPHLSKLHRSRTLERYFNSIVAWQDERDVIVSGVAAALHKGLSPQGYLRAGDVSTYDRPPSRSFCVAPPVPVFAPEPILWTRFSPRRCYWDRCTFCVQNLKYTEPQPPMLSEVPLAVEKLKAASVAGYSTIILSDEALSPAMLERFSQRAVEIQLNVRWGCRCKLERTFSPGLFCRMRTAGCFDVLFGLESISPRVQQRMDKHVLRLDRVQIASLLRAADAAGLGVHVNLIAGFPGDTLEEVSASVDFTIDILKPFSDATFYLNTFTLYHGSAVAEHPEVFGIERLEKGGDMPVAHDFRFLAGYARNGDMVKRSIPELRARLMKELGWVQYGQSTGTQAAISLYFTSGHRYSGVFGRLGSAWSQNYGREEMQCRA
jgi:hypothetical protein